MLRPFFKTISFCEQRSPTYTDWGLNGSFEIINSGSYLLRVLNIKKPIKFHGKKLNLL